MSLQQLQEKWAPVLNHESVPEISDNYKKGVVAQLLENQELAIKEEGQILSETLQTTGYTTGDTATGLSLIHISEPTRPY